MGVKFSDFLRELNEGKESYKSISSALKKELKAFPGGGTRGFQAGIAIKNAIKDLKGEGFFEQADIDELHSVLR